MTAPDKIWVNLDDNTDGCCPVETDLDDVGKFFDASQATEYTRTDLSQASVAAALEAAAKEHDAEIVRLEAQIIENKNYLRLVGKSERSSANDFCNTAIGHHRGSAVRLRDLITPAQHDALAAHVAAQVAKARAEEFNRGVRAGCYAALAHLDRHDYREDVTRSGLQDEILAAQIGAKP